MKSSSGKYRNISYAKSSFLNFLACHKPYVFVCVLIVVFGITLGVLNACRVNDLQLNNMIIKAVYKFIKHNKSMWGLFFSLVLLYTIPMLIIVLLNINKLTSILTYLSLLSIGYCLGFDCAVLILLRPIGGIITTVICFVPCSVLIICLFIVVAAIFLKKNYVQKKFGCNYKPNFNYFKFVVICYIFMCLIVLLQCFLFNITRIIIII